MSRSSHPLLLPVTLVSASRLQSRSGYRNEGNTRRCPSQYASAAATIRLTPPATRQYVRLFKLLRIFPKALLALFAGKSHVENLHELVVLDLPVTFCTVEPFTAAGRADGNLGVENVFT